MIPKHIIIHHSAYEDVPIEVIDEMHRERGFDMIGYHYYIRRNGKVEVGREETQTGAHCRANGMNHKSIGICLAGNFTLTEPSKEQIRSANLLVHSIKHRYDIESVLGHREVEGAATLCPAFDEDLVRNGDV